MTKWYNTTHQDLKVSKAGELALADGTPISQYIAKWGNSDTEYYMCYHRGKTHLVHILVCETFHPKTEDDIANNRILVNHKDGNSLNNANTNVEWANYSDNLLHAYKAGLRTDNKIVHVHDLATGVITEHYSQAEAARFMGTNAPKLCGYFASKRTQPFSGKYGVWRNGEEPSPFTATDCTKKINGSPDPIIAFNKDTLRVFKVGSQGRAVKLTGIKRATIGYYLKNRTRNKGKAGNGIWEFWFESEYASEAGSVEIVLGNNLTTPPVTKMKPLEVSVKNIVTGEEETYESINSFIEKFKLSASLTKKKAYLGIPVKDKWLVRYIR